VYCTSQKELIGSLTLSFLNFLGGGLLLHNFLLLYDLKWHEMFSSIFKKLRKRKFSDNELALVDMENDLRHCACTRVRVCVSLCTLWQYNLLPTPMVVTWVAFSVCLCVYLFVCLSTRYLKKPMQSGSQNVTQKCFTVCPGNPFISGLKGHRSRSWGRKKHSGVRWSWCSCKCWLLLVFTIQINKYLAHLLFYQSVNSSLLRGVNSIFITFD